MKLFSLRSLLLLAGLTTGLSAVADCCKAKPKADTGQSCCEAASTEAKPAAPYPLETCVVSGDKLEDGDMGPPIDYVFKQEGKPDRLVRLCCKACIKTFNQTPEKFLKLIDDAAAAKAKGEKPADSGRDKH